MATSRHCGRSWVWANYQMSARGPPQVRYKPVDPTKSADAPIVCQIVVFCMDMHSTCTRTGTLGGATLSVLPLGAAATPVASWHASSE